MSARNKFWVFLLGVLVLAQVLASLFIARGETLTIASDLIQGALLLVATTAFLPNASRTRSPMRRTRIFWILMSLGMLFWLAYQLMWNYFEVWKHQNVPDLFTGDVVLFLHLVPMMAALAFLPHLREEERDTRIRMLDFALLLTWWIFLYVYTVIPWQTVQVDERVYSANLNTLYLIEKLVLLAALAVLAYAARGGWRQLYAQLLGASALYASTSYLANWAIGRQIYYSGSVYDIPWVFSVAWLAMIGKLAGHFDLTESKQSQPLLGVGITRLGMIALFSLPWFALYSLLETGLPPSVQAFRVTLTLLTIVVMGTMVFWRQSLLAAELSLLLETSRRSFEELKTLQAQLIQSEKAASMGQLVGGAAHEINNPLTAMLGYSDLLGTSTLPPRERRLAERVADHVRRTKTLVASLLTFARQAPAKMALVNLNSVVQTVLRLLAPQLEAQAIGLRSELGPSLPPVLADSNQLLHVCMHLASQVSTRVRAEVSPVLQILTRCEGDRVVVEFSSDAPSASFTYQPLQDSTSGAKSATLSLSACCRIIEEHSGSILACGSTEGYTAFRVVLPVMAQPAGQSLSSGSSGATRAAHTGS